jgi:hypothetical protein
VLTDACVSQVAIQDYHTYYELYEDRRRAARKAYLF